ncbi:MAG: PqqD family protein [Dehalococcoidia bacterium]
MNISNDFYFSERGFLFDTNTGLTFSLNKSGAFVFQQLKKGLDAAHIAEALVEKYGVDEKTAAGDVRDFIQRLKDFRLAAD